LQIGYADSVAAAKAANSPKSAKRSGTRVDTAETPPPISIKTTSGADAQYLLIPPAKGAEQPKAGYPLLLVLAGGDGSADFHPFIRSVHEKALDGRFVVAQPLAPPQIVWPTKSSTVRPATTEESIVAIIDDAAKRHAIDRGHVYALAWSSSGPAVYATLLQKGSPLAGGLIAMSVFKPNQLPPLEHAAGHRFYLLHSPTDAICPYRMAEDAKNQLAASGAEVTLVDYPGGHGWHGPVFENIRAGMAWLQQSQ
jgi:predicted esterase